MFTMIQITCLERHKILRFILSALIFLTITRGITHWPITGPIIVELEEMFSANTESGFLYDYAQIHLMRN